MNEFAGDGLARRLVSLEPRVNSTALARRVLTGGDTGRRQRHPRVLLVASVAALLLVATAALASYYAPVFAQAVADAPIAGSITGWMLRNVGLAGVPHRVTAMSDTSTSSGYQVELVGGYADVGRTILFLRASPAARVVMPTRAGQELSLTDQFGQSYRAQGATEDSATGEHAIIFEPLRWPATAVGARLHLSFNTLEVGVPPASSVVGGRWQLVGTLALDAARDLTRPPDGAIGEMRLSFSRVRATPSALLLDLNVQPGTLDLNRIVPDGLKGHNAFSLRLVDDTGHERTLLGGQNGSSGSGAIQSSWIWLLDAPGQYKLEISYEGVGSLTRQIEVP